MRKLIGLHTGQGWNQQLDVIKAWQPPVVLVLNPNREQVQQLRQTCPDTIIVGRIYVEDGWANNYLKNDPVGFALHTHNAIVNANIPEVNYWVMLNEPTPYWDWLPSIDTYSLELMKLADTKGYKVGILSLSVGNFDLPQHDPMVYWRQIEKSLHYAQDHQHVVLVHQYQKPNLINNDESDNWLIFRLEKKVLPGLKEMGLGNLKFIISEIGVDHLINSGKVGGFQNTPLTDRQYFDQLITWEEREQEYENVLGSCIFMFGEQNPWQSYSITSNSNVAKMLAAHYTNHGGDYGPVDDNDNTVFIPIVVNEPKKDEDMAQIEWDENLTKRGVELKAYKPKVGEVYWKCIKGEYLEEKEHIFVNTLDQNEMPKPGVMVRFYWADDHADKPTKDISNDPYAYGMVDFDMHAHGNSYGAKVVDGVVGSDDIWGMGLGSVEHPDWNIHVSYRFTFQLVKAKKSSTKPPKPVEPTPEEPKPEVPKIEDSLFKGRVMATVLNVRSEPKMGDNIVNKLANGAVVDVLGEKNGWYQIGDNQWVAKEWIEKYSPEDGLVDALLEQFSRTYQIDPDAVRAAFAIESGGKPFGVNGKPIIRFENHVFFDQLNDPDTYYKNFKHDKNTDSHRWRDPETGEWVAFHGNQQLEWKVYEFAKTLNETAANNSISMGMGQVMGFNFDDLGYKNAHEMMEAFSQSGGAGIIAQVFAFFQFCLSRGLIDDLKNKNWDNFAMVYNGSHAYAQLLENQYNKYKAGK